MSLKTMRLLPMGMFSLLVAVLVLTGCSGATDIEDYVGGPGSSAPYDPSKAVTITDFTPKSGGVGQQLVIKGENFGNDTSIVKVMIGGREAPLVSVKGSHIYCFVPSGAYSGEIEVTIGGETGKTAAASEVFFYERKMVVGSLCGYKNAQDNQGWEPGPFETCAGFRNDGVMQFSPYNKSQLFIVYDKEPNWEGQHAIQLLDLEKETVEDVLPASLFVGNGATIDNQRLRTIDFAKDPFYYDKNGNYLGRLADQDEYTQEAFKNDTECNRWSEHLIVSVDAPFKDTYDASSVYIVHRDKATGEFNSNSKSILLCRYNQCNGAALHPINGELYFTSYSQGQLLRCDMDAYWDAVEVSVSNDVDDPLTEDVDESQNKVINYELVAWDNVATQNDDNPYMHVIFPIQDNAFECQIDMHPEGDYAYIVVINRHYILKTDYNHDLKTFTTPYQIAGQLGQTGTDDGAGKSAKLHRPYQGAFAQNPEYIANGNSDIYDFFFCDSQGHTVRSITPEGIVSTYAGGGATTHADGKREGNENGELRDVARFNRPTGFVTKLTDEVLDADGMPTRIFYILDTQNRQIRTIGYENEKQEEPGTDEPGTDEPGTEDPGTDDPNAGNEGE